MSVITDLGNKTGTTALHAEQYLAAILQGVLPRPERLRIEQEYAGDVTVLTIHVPLDDRRFVVGRRGRTIEAVRDLLRAYAGRRSMPPSSGYSKEGAIC